MNRRKAKIVTHATGSNLLRPPRWRRWIGIITVAVAIACLLVVYVRRGRKGPAIPLAAASAKIPQTGPLTMVIKNSKKSIVVTEAEAVQFVNSLLAAINPSNAENSYMPPFMKEKITWVYSKIALKRIKLNASPYFQKNIDGSDNTTCFMDSGYFSANNDDKPPYTGVLNLYVPRLYSYVRLQQEVPDGFNQLSKNTFALMFVHEAVHFEKPPEYFLGSHSAQKNIQEEARAWLKVNANADRPLRKIGQPLDIDWTDSDDRLKRCNDNPQCPEFLSFITGADRGSDYSHYHR
jgi:hypothetical protein